MRAYGAALDSISDRGRAAIAFSVFTLVALLSPQNVVEGAARSTDFPTTGTQIRLSQGESSTSPDQAAAIARRLTGGRILSIELKDSVRENVYEVKVLLPNGHIRIVRIDAASGIPTGED